MAWSTTPISATWVNRVTIYVKMNNYTINGYVEAARASGNAYYLHLHYGYDGVLGNMYLYPGAGTNNSSYSDWYYTGSGEGTVTTGISPSNTNPRESGAAYNTISIPAKWTFPITYYGNGNTGGNTAGQTHTSGTATSISANGFTKTGYHFTGWNTNAAGTGTAYAVGASYNSDAALTLYAQWAIDTYAVTYDGNGADGGSTAGQTKTYGVDLTLQQNGFTKDKYVFVGWNTAADGTGTAYAEGDTYTTNAPLLLYAQWVKANIPAFVRVDNDIHQVEKAYIRVGNTIKEAEVYIRIGNEIKHIV